MMASEAHDPQTLAFYDSEAPKYAARSKPGRKKSLEAFLALLKPGSKILELGSGDGQDAEAMIQAGFDVTPTDGSIGLAREAEKRLQRPVRIMRFGDLAERDAYDAIWASACLLHVPAEHLPGVLVRIHTALRSNGRFFASYKMGDGGERDSLGRYYNFPSRETLTELYKGSGLWTDIVMKEAASGGYDGVARTSIQVTVVRNA
jgi:cyclopropane fatty-acyl-phospholipid synthase-like methyltransferase